MKELSIEEKRYDGNYTVYTELINRLEDVKNAIKKQNYGIAMDILCKSYPEFQITTSTELAESKDEKIRQFLIHEVTETSDEIISYRNMNKKDVLAYLEKQGEQKYIPKHKVGDTIYYNSFGEVKSMIVANVVTDSTDNPMYEDKDGNSVFEKDLVEQKPAWGEEDEKMRAAVLQLITDSEKENGWNCVYCNDKEIYFSDIIAWLKSLRPQNTWKPSDEQIGLLQAIVNDPNNASSESCQIVLKEVIRQLKKLKE